MLSNRTIFSRLATWGAASLASVIALIPSCSSDDSGNSPDGGQDATNSSSSGSSSGSSSSSSSSSSSGSSSGSGSSSSGSGSSSGAIHDSGMEAEGGEAGLDASMCANPGKPTPGPVDNHCTVDDGGSTVQPTSAASCMPDVAAPEAGATCAYGVTMFGNESDDDDCKYHLKWSSTPICEGAPGVLVTVVVTHKTDRTNAMDASAAQPLTGANPGIEAFTTSPGDWDSAAFCDTMSTHPSIPPGGTGYWPMTESNSTPGTYTGFVQFDQAGQWTVRFHFNHNCEDTLPDSPHGHAAYHVTVP